MSLGRPTIAVSSMLVADEPSELLRLLREAEAAAERLGDEPRDPAERPRYFRNPELDAALARVADYRGQITIVVGAGASMEANLPSWPALVGRLLRQLADERLDASIRDQWIDAVRSESLTAAAAVVEALSADEASFRDRVRAALYGGLPTTAYQPQALAQQVAWLKRELGDAVRIATGNYDGLLEQALGEAGLEVHSYIQRRDEARGSAAVYHLHGRLIPAYPRTGRIVLSESDYARVQQERSWQDQFMREALDNSLCIFVGASLTDPNLIRWLYRYTPEAADLAGHIALFTRQATPAMRPDVRAAVETAARARWNRVHVDAVFADFFGELAQFLHEVAARRVDERLQSFAARARARFEAARALVLPSDPDAFREAQARVSQYLRERLDGVVGIAEAGGIDVSGERLGLGLWGVNHATGEVGLWATADREFTDPAAIIYNPLEYQSRWIASEAVTRGVPVERDPRVYASRWRLIRGVPVVVPSDGSAGRVVVGVMTLTSMTPLAESLLLRSRDVSGSIDGYLADAGAFLFE
jgi:SIR2-like domain